ncbi:MAG: SpoIIE family protein phosphatase, partial [Bacteroidia bacterium]
KHFVKISRQYRKIKPDSAFAYLNKAFALAEKINNRFFLHVYNEKISYLKSKGDLKPVIDTALRALQFAEKFKDDFYTPSFNLELGVLYRKLGNYDKSIMHLLKAIEGAKKINYQNGLYNSYNSLGNTYSQEGVIKKAPSDLNRALQSYQKAFEYIDKKNIKVLGMMLNNQGVTYQNLGQITGDSNATKSSIDYYKKSLAYRIEAGDSIDISLSYNNIGGSYHDMCEFFHHYTYMNDALINYKKSIEIDKKINSPESYSNLTNYASHLAFMGQMNNDKKLLEEAMELLKTSLQTSLFNKDTHKTLTIYDNLAGCYESLNQKDSALAYLHKFVSFKDTLLNEENKQVAEELAAKYESDLKDAENNNLKQQAELREEVISKKSNTIKLMVIASLIMLGLIVTVFISRQKINKSRELIRIQQIETEKQKLLIEEKQKEILDSINYSKRLQDAAIPSVEYFKSLLPHSFIYYRPKDIVAGDFYWVHEVRKNNSNLILVAAADCTGHGVPGALVSIVCLNALNRCVEEFNLTEPAQILDKAADIIQQSFRQSENDVKDGMDIALCLLDLEKYKGYFAGANNPVWILNGKEVKEIKGDNQPVGQQHIPKPFTQHSFEIKKGDTILLSTDGYTDQFGGEKGKKLKTKKFKEVFPELNKLEISEINSKITSMFEDWKGNHEQVDDVLVIGIRV